MRNERGASTSFALTIIVILMVGLWSISSFLIQEKNTYSKYRDYTTSLYRVEAVQEAFIYSLKDTLKSATWNMDEFIPGETELLSNEDADDIRNFLETNLAYQTAVGLDSEDVHIGNLTWLDGTCTNPLPPIEDFTPMNLCARLQFTADGISRSVTVEIDNITFNYDSVSAWIMDTSPIQISDVQ